MAARIFLSMGTWLQQHCLTTDRHLPCILFSISMQYSNIPCSKSHPSQSAKYQMSHPSSPRVRMFCALKKNLRPGHFSKRKSQASHDTFVINSYCTHKYGRILASTTSSRLPWKTLYFVLDGMEESLVVKICHIWYSFGSKRSAKLEKRKINLSWTY